MPKYHVPAAGSPSQKREASVVGQSVFLGRSNGARGPPSLEGPVLYIELVEGELL